MIDATFLHEQNSQSQTDLHIVLRLVPPKTMSGRRNDSGLGSSSAYHSQSSPHRRSMAIQDLLNPSVEERSSHSQYQHKGPALTGGPTYRTSLDIGTSRYSRSSPPRVSHRPRQSPPQVRRYARASSPQASRYSRPSPPSPALERPGSWRLLQTAQQRTHTPSSSTRFSGTRREFRPTYSEEEALFIWYHRVDLGLDWQDITNAYKRQFPERPREGPGGIQCKYYRCCAENNIPKVRERDKSASAVEEYGMKARTGLHYPWMRD